MFLKLRKLETPKNPTMEKWLIKYSHIIKYYLYIEIIYDIYYIKLYYTKWKNIGYQII